MEEKDSVSIWFVRQALMGLQQRGRPYESLLLDAGIQPGLLRSDQSRVSARSFGALWLAIASVLDDEFFGLDRRRMKVGSFALLCRSTVQAPNLGHALGLAVQYFNILLDDTRLELASDGEDLRILLIDRAGAERPFVGRQLDDLLGGSVFWSFADIYLHERRTTVCSGRSKRRKRSRILARSAAQFHREVQRPQKFQGTHSPETALNAAR